MTTYGDGYMTGYDSGYDAAKHDHGVYTEREIERLGEGYAADIFADQNLVDDFICGFTDGFLDYRQDHNPK